MEMVRMEEEMAGHQCIIGFGHLPAAADHWICVRLPWTGRPVNLASHGPRSAGLFSLETGRAARVARANHANGPRNARLMNPTQPILQSR